MNLSLLKTLSRVLFITFVCIGFCANAQTVYVWNGSSTTSNSGINPNITSASFNSTQGNNNGTTTLITTATASSGYAGASGTSNFGAACKIGALSTSSSTYFSLVVTPSTNYKIQLNSISLGSRGTGTGPTVLTFYSSIDGYTTAIGSASVSANSAWALTNVTFTGTNLIGVSDSSVTLRIYGSGGTGSPGVNTANWRIDDVNLSVTSFTTPSGPTVTTTAATEISTTGADLNGSINANGTTTDASFEYGTTVAYGFSATATPSTATGTTATSISATIGSLALNTQYHYRAVGTESLTAYNGNDLTFYTLAATPGVLAVSNPMQTTLDVTVNATTENSNPSVTEYAIQETGGQYVQANGSLGATAVWQTASVWATTTVTGLNFSTSYTFSAKARNGAAVETGFGSPASETTLAAQTVDYAVIQSPTTTQNVLEGGSLTVYIKAYEPGLTTLSGEQSNLFGWVGYSSTNDDPSNAGWTWVPATFNVEIGNDDEYVATLSGLAIGTYYYAGRFQIGTGPYVYAGSGGVWNNDNVTLNINADVVDFANIQSPTSGTITEGTTNFDVYAQVYELGVTEAAGQGAGISAWIGYSSSDSNPNGNDWTWVSAAFNVQVGNNDEYVANIATGLTPGTYYYASRFLKTGSSTYVYGGTNGNWNDDNGVLTIEGLGTPIANDATDITQTQFNANWDAVAGASSYEVDVYTKVGGSVEVIDQTFTWADYSTANGTGGNSGGWNGSIASITFDISNWTDIAGYKGDNCAKMGAGSTQGSITTPVFGEAGDAVVTFRAGAWDGGSEQTTLLLEITGGGTLSVSSVEMVKGAFSNYNVTITGATVLTQLTFRAFQASNARFFIDDINVVVGSEVITPVSGSPFTTSNTTLPVTGLDSQTTYYYVVRAINGSVETVNSNEIEVETKPSVVTWSGTAWSNIAGPDETIDAILVGPYNTTANAGFTAKNLTVSTGGSLTIGAGTSVTVANELNNELTAAAVVINSDGSLIQEGTTNTNSGNITVLRNSQDLMRLDYTMWSSPVAAQNLGGFSPFTMTNRFYTYNTATDVYATIANTNNFAVGQGYLIRTPDNHPTSATSWSGQFIGLPNSGDVTVGLSAAGQGFNLVGNPYPSPISISTLLSENTGVIGGNLYFWRKTNGATGSAYITYSGGTFSDGPHEYNNIQPGQGFIVAAVSGADLTFTNTQRQADNGDFYRNANATQSEGNSRIWLNVSTNNAVVGQMAIGYNATASNDIDASDAAYINDNAVALNSFVANTELAVQHRASFEAIDVVPLRFKTNAAGSYTIAINDVDGLFTNEAQTIFLKDNLLNIEHDLRNSAYQFTSDSGVFADRFEVVYQSTLGVTIPEFANQTIVFAKDNNLNVQSGSSIIKGIQVFDVQGRLVLDVKDINSTSYSASLEQISNGVLLVKVFADNGISTTKKIIK
ncbi:T9SS sorting signal type C domain-containing protein [Flavobacterium azooxidireducens]|uniref:T9SS sorting signal type C domain-containing protein n=1 Tax=Flavobacterium azooxidireducens TaxID=1871076 RepID=A0ABY4KB09_9FLAO|nr:T9SS sorting signal type C domain-containing protein [Flavobacterium azooxidireducens]UPQ77976.1 T9SS sorting signal type C domain-containing protein [Flavobacterium azooxidireducens]